MKIDNWEQLKIGDNVMSDSVSTCASGRHEGEVIKIDDIYIYTLTRHGKISKWYKHNLTNINYDNYHLEWVTSKTEKEYYGF